MTTANSSPYLRTSRNFPITAQPLAVEVNKTYVDIASAVNLRTIGLFPTTVSANTGEQWYLTANQRQQTIRQVYTFTSAGSIAHGIKFGMIGGITKIYGTFTDGANWYPLPYIDVTAANNQVNVIVNDTNIVITAGAGSSPSISSGYVILEWLSTI